MRFFNIRGVKNNRHMIHPPSGLSGPLPLSVMSSFHFQENIHFPIQSHRGKERFTQTERQMETLTSCIKYIILCGVNTMPTIEV